MAVCIVRQSQQGITLTYNQFPRDVKDVIKSLSTASFWIEFSIPTPHAYRERANAIQKNCCGQYNCHKIQIHYLLSCSNISGIVSISMLCGKTLDFSLFILMSCNYAIMHY